MSTGVFGEATMPISHLHDSKLKQQGLTATSFFEGLHNHAKGQWSSLKK
jgi:hypothetical protein